MSQTLREKLEAGQFVVTGELAPPKGTNVEKLRQNARNLKEHVDAINITDNQRSIMKLSSLASCLILKEEGVEPVIQVTCRDRNRIALQSDILSADVLGVHNVLTLTGDPVRVGDHTEAKPVFDWNSMGLIEAITNLNKGIDSEGHPLNGPTHIFIGGAINPSSAQTGSQLDRLQKKIDLGVHFIQTQAIYDMEKFQEFMEGVQKRNMKVFIVAGILLLKSAKMARFINKKVPGIHVPEAMISELEKDPDPLKKGIEIASQQMAQCRQLCHGAHLMTVGIEEKILDIIQAESALKLG